MKKEEYLNIITDEIKKAKKLKEDSENQIQFYINIEGKDSKKVQEAINNFDLANARITALDGIGMYPAYERIKNMTSCEVELYKKKIIEKKEKEKKNLERDILEINNNIKYAENNIDSIIDLYKNNPKKLMSLYKTDNFDDYVNHGKEITSYINQCKTELDRKKESIKEIQNDISKINQLDEEAIKENIIRDFNLQYIENELNKFTVSDLDRLVTSIYNDQEKINNIIKELKDYNEINNKIINKKIILPKILNDYKVFYSSKSLITENIELTTIDSNIDEITVYDEGDFSLLSSNLDNYKKSLVDFKNYIEYLRKALRLFPTSFDLNRIISFLDDLECYNRSFYNYVASNLTDELKKIYVDYVKIMKKNKTKRNLNKKIILEYSLENKAKEILNLLWDNICQRIIAYIVHIKYDAEFYSIINYDNVKEKYINDCPLIIETGRYSDLSLFSMKILMEQIINKTVQIIEAINEMKENFTKYEKEMKDSKKTKKDNLEKISSKIYELFNKNIDIEDYNIIYNNLTTTGLENSKARIEREELINKVKLECLNQLKYNISDLDKYKEEISKNEDVNPKKEEENKSDTFDSILERFSKKSDGKNIEDVMKKILKK